MCLHIFNFSSFIRWKYHISCPSKRKESLCPLQIIKFIVSNKLLVFLQNTKILSTSGFGKVLSCFTSVEEVSKYQQQPQGQLYHPAQGPLRSSTSCSMRAYCRYRILWLSWAFLLQNKENWKSLLEVTRISFTIYFVQTNFIVQQDSFHLFFALLESWAKASISITQLEDYHRM